MADPATQVHGFCDERCQEFEHLLRSNLERGVDVGASLAIAHRGELIVDLWGGTRDYQRSQPWTADTLVRVLSTSKVPLAMTALAVVDRGLVDLDQPIADHWPEFARHGKGAITLRQVLTHRSGLPGFGRQVTMAELADWDLVVGFLEDAEPWFEPGSAMCYGPYSYGFITGELVQRVTGRAFAEFFDGEIAGPAGAEFFFRLTAPADHERVAAIWPDDHEPEIDTPMGARVWAELEVTTEFVDPAFLPAVLPAVSGITNARGLVRIGSILAQGGELDGRRYLSEAIVAEASREQVVAVDEMLGPIRMGLGFGLHSAEYPAPTPTTFHWGGYGGSFLTMDRTTGLSVGFTPNQFRFGDEFRDAQRQLELFELIGEVSARFE